MPPPSPGRRPIARLAAAAAVLLALGACGPLAGPTTAAPPSTAASPGPGAAPSDAGAAPGSSPSAPAGHVDEVTFDSDGLTLRGDLHLPEGTGPHRGVVLLHGSGPIDRDGTVSGQLGMTFPQPVTVLADLAMALRAAGYAVLTYDKRTCGPFNGCADNGYPQPPADLTVDKFVADAVAAIDHLRARDDIRPDAIGVVGHSQSAAFVPPLLIDEPDLVAGVMLAAPFDPLDDLLGAQADHIAELAARDDAAPQLQEAARAQRELADGIGALRTSNADDDTTLGGTSAQFWRSWLRVSDGVADLAATVERPLLVVGGGHDTNVPPLQTRQWDRRLSREEHRVVLLDCVTHALNCITSEHVSAAEPADIGTSVDPRVGATVAEFLDGAMP